MSSCSYKLLIMLSVSGIILNGTDVRCDLLFDHNIVNEHTKNILLWNPFYHSSDYFFGLGRKPFMEHNCTVSQCYMTNDRRYINIQKFDAIVFHGGTFIHLNRADYPAARSPRQLYVFFTYESPDRVATHPSLGGVFNVTVTYRQDSDIPYQFFNIADFKGRIVAPTFTPNWTNATSRYVNQQKYGEIYANKSKPIAWFVSNCYTSSRREEYIAILNEYIAVDTYGYCGPRKCDYTRTDTTYCSNLLKQVYYFYLAFENSLCKDYLTEKVMTAYINDVVPVVYGGADLDKFLPPMSYIDATKYHPRHLSALLKSLINSKREYSKYFWWREFYEYRIVQPVPTFCSLCEMLHDTRREPKRYDDFSTWWEGDENNRYCKDGRKMLQDNRYTERSIHPP